MEEASHPGCLIRCRVLGIIEAEQAEEGSRFRNDRLIVAPVVEGKHAEPRSLVDLSPGFIEEVKRFFVAYNRTAGREIRILGHHGPERAEKLIRAAMRKK
jgi:inorganic pyrophosphatase